MIYVKFEELDDVRKELLNAAEESMHTHVFSDSDGDTNYYIGAALLTYDDQIIAALHSEDSTLGPRNCPEGTVLTKANNMGQRGYKSIAFISDAPYDKGGMKGPCNSCRKMIKGFAGLDLEIILSTAEKDRIVVTSIGELSN